MRTARVLGSCVECLIKENQISIKQLSELLNCTEYQLQRFFKGRVLLSYAQIKVIADTFGVSVGDLLAGNIDCYKANIIDCNPECDNKEMILDIIDDYMDVCEAMKGCE